MVSGLTTNFSYLTWKMECERELLMLAEVALVARFCYKQGFTLMPSARKLITSFMLSTSIADSPTIVISPLFDYLISKAFIWLLSKSKIFSL